MNQTLASPAPRPAPAPVQTALFDLLARSWALDAPVASVTMDAAGKAAAFALDDGRMALVPLDDAESPVSRFRMELASGRSTIRPREKPVPAPVLTPSLADAAPLVVPSGRIGFVAAGRDGTLQRITPRGQIIALTRDPRPVGAIASDGRGRLAIAYDGKAELVDEDGLSRIAGLLTPGMASGLAFSPDGACLAVLTGDGLVLWQQGQDFQSHPLGGAGPVVFSPRGGWLAGGNGKDGFWLLDRRDGRIARLGNFRTPPRALGFGHDDGTVIASGAFRVAAWSLATPPFEAEATGALRTGRAGLVLIDRIAPHPARDLIAFGAADGSVAIARPGLPEEMVLRAADGDAITALAWSASGLHLAIGTAGGAAALVTLPPQLFK